MKRSLEPREESPYQSNYLKWKKPGARHTKGLKKATKEFIGGRNVVVRERKGEGAFTKHTKSRKGSLACNDSS